MTNEEQLLMDIMDIFYTTIFDGIKENPELFPIFMSVSRINGQVQDYSIYSLDNTIFDALINEVVVYLK
jgi:hypothetical protein